MEVNHKKGLTVKTSCTTLYLLHDESGLGYTCIKLGEVVVENSIFQLLVVVSTGMTLE